MSESPFDVAEQVLINAIKGNLQSHIDTKGIFWNGITKDCVIAGGFFASTINGEPFKDIDVFVLKKNFSVYNDIAQFVNGDQWQIRDAMAAPEYLKNPHIHDTDFNTRTKVQYILTDYATRQELIADFDYKHTTVSYVPLEKKLYITRGAFDAIRNKELIVNGNKEPKAWRMEKFVNRGWRTSTIDHHQGLNDSYNQTIKQSVADMLKRISQQKGMLPTLDEKDIDIEAFQQLIK